MVALFLKKKKVWAAAEEVVKWRDVVASLERITEKEWVQARVAGVDLHNLQEALSMLLRRSGRKDALALEQNTATSMQRGGGHQEGEWAGLRRMLSQALDGVFVQTCTVALGVWDAARFLR